MNRINKTTRVVNEDNKGRIVMQIRDPKRYSWSGAALPGGDRKGVKNNIKHAIDFYCIRISF